MSPSDEGSGSRPREKDRPERGGEARDRIEPPAAYQDATAGERAVPAAEVMAHEAERPGAAVDLEPNVERIHRALVREPRDPEEGREAVPWWLWTIAALALFWGGWYLGRHGGVLGPATHTAFAGRAGPVAEQAADQQQQAISDPIAAGRTIYGQHCQSCHQESGLGVPGAFPPLIGSEWVNGPAETVIRILLHGLQGPIQVAGQSYNGAMPAWRDVLSDAEIASVSTYVRQWGANDASAVGPEEVAALREATQSRAQPWTAEELRAAEAGGPGGANQGAGGAP